MQSNVIKAIHINTFADLLSAIPDDRDGQTLNMGGALISNHVHPQYGSLTLISEALNGGCAVIVSAEHADKIAGLQTV